MPDEPIPPTYGLESLRLRLSQILEDLAHPPLAAGVALAEECGEVSKLLLDHHAYGRPLEKDQLASELLDVLVCLCEIATLHGIDLDAAAQSKLADLGLRAPEWRRTLAGPLKRARSPPAPP
jgi:NTP pyrophosphatase (non-canonical NTP hydrolase)